MRVARVRSRGAELALFERGSGLPIVLVHGWSMSSRFFHHQLAVELPGCRVISIDMRGHGASDKPHDGHTMAGYAADVLAVLEELDLHDVVLAGWSMGAFVAWEYIRRYRTSRLRGLVVIDSPASDLHDERRPYGVTMQQLGSVVDRLQTDQRAAVEAFLPRMFAATPGADDLAWMRDDVLQVPASVACTVFVGQTVQDYTPDLGAVDVPALVCFGADEQFYPVATGRELAEAMPRARLEVFEHSSHCPFLEEPERFNAVLSEFTG